MVRIVLTAAAALLLPACGPDYGSGKVVVAAAYPIAAAAEKVTSGTGTSVYTLTPPGVEPHDYELTASDVELLQRADVVLYLGGGFQPALEAALRSAPGEKVDLLARLGVGEDDPHVWLDPGLYARLVGEVGAALGDAQGAEPFRRQVEELAGEYSAGLADCERRDIVTSHAAFGYLARAYGLRQVPISGIAPGAEASPQELGRIADFVRESGTTTVFVEPLAPPDEADALARETGARTATLDPLESAAEGESYLSRMRANLAALRKALECR